MIIGVLRRLVSAMIDVPSVDNSYCVLAEVEGRNRNRIRGRPGQQMDSRKASQLLKLPPSGASKAMMTHKYP